MTSPGDLQKVVLHLLEKINIINNIKSRPTRLGGFFCAVILLYCDSTITIIPTHNM